MREHPADQGAVRALGQEAGQRIVQRERSRVPQLQDADGGERLRDRPDPVLRVGRRAFVRFDVRETEGLLPEQLVAAKDRGADGRHSLLGLGRRELPRQLFPQSLRR